jgi:adenylate cyclase
MLDDPDLIELDLVAVKGKSQGVKVFTLAPPGEEEAPVKSPHAELIAAYRRQDWASALATLGQAPLAAAHYLAPVYELYRTRIAHFQTEPPPPDWDGVFTATEK